MTNLATAVRLAQAGLHIFQAHPETKAPWFTKVATARNSPVLIDRLWQQHPEMLPAIAVGRSGLFVLDLDVGHKEGVNGVEAFSALVAEHGFPDDVPAVRTPRGGIHLYLTQRDDDIYLSNATTGLPPGIDIRADPRNGYTIGPDAIMATGEFYEGVAGTPDLAEAYAAGAIPAVPVWILDIMDAAVSAEIEVRSAGCAAHVLAGDASDTRRRGWALGALDREARKLAGTGVGGRNHALNRFAYVMGGHSPQVSYSEVWDAAWSACNVNCYLTSRDPSDGPRAFKRTFNNGWRDGTTKPLPGPRDAPDPWAGQEISFVKKDRPGGNCLTGQHNTNHRSPGRFNRAKSPRQAQAHQPSR